MWNRWSNYWLAPGGRRSVAALRIAIATSLLWMLWRIDSAADLTSARSYYAIGLWQLVPGRPGLTVVSAIEIVAWVSTLAMLVGAGARVAHTVSAISVLAIATLASSQTPEWSHENVPPMLATLAFLGARGGDAWSLDAWWRRRRGTPLPAGVPYQASARLVQVAVAAVFFIAACSKLKAGLGVGWALSDNLRHQLLVRFDWIRLPRTAMAGWLLGAAWRYELFAVLNLISQTSQIAAVFLVRWPLLRAVLGGMFCIEVLALGVVMDLWDLHWLPLAAAFIDWDALIARARGGREVEAAPARAPGHVAFATLFIAFFAIQAAWLNQRLHAYPFSAFPLFATVRAKRPYGVHQAYELIGGRIEPIAGRALTGDEESWIASRAIYRWIWHDRDPIQLRRDLAVILDETRAAFPSAGITGVRLWLSVYQAPAYPAPARLDRTDVAVIGELGSDGVLHTALGALAADRVTVAGGQGVNLADTHLATMQKDLPPPLAVDSTPTATGARLAVPLAGDPIYLIATPCCDSHPWLVGGLSHRGW